MSSNRSVKYETPTSVRTDQWLWAARCFKTRSLAAKACKGGHVKVNNKTAKPSYQIRPGDVVHVLTLGGLRILQVENLSTVRGSFTIAQTLYDDLTPEPDPKEIAPPRMTRSKGRPTKKDRRRLDRLKGR